MFANIIAARYAMAVMQSCPDLAMIERVEDELVLLRETYERHPEIRAFLINPKLPPQVKKKILRDSLTDKFSDLVLRLLDLLIDKRRQDILPEIADRFDVLTDQARGIEHADIIVATPISPDLAELLKGAIQKFSGRQVETEIRVDESIIGGVQIKLGDKVIDGSLKRRFDDLRRAMLAARLPALGLITDNGGVPEN
ncbi:ATP synthase F1 subunit delta [bacterium]|nr:ATP synthase F1 subunit delta [bacterium]